MFITNEHLSDLLTLLISGATCTDEKNSFLNQRYVVFLCTFVGLSFIWHSYCLKNSYKIGKIQRSKFRIVRFRMFLFRTLFCVKHLLSVCFLFQLVLLLIHFNNILHSYTDPNKDNEGSLVLPRLSSFGRIDHIYYTQ